MPTRHKHRILVIRKADNTLPLVLPLLLLRIPRLHHCWGCWRRHGGGRALVLPEEPQRAREGLRFGRAVERLPLGTLVALVAVDGHGGVDAEPAVLDVLLGLFGKLEDGVDENVRVQRPPGPNGPLGHVPDDLLVKTHLGDFVYYPVVFVSKIHWLKKNGCALVVLSFVCLFELFSFQELKRGIFKKNLRI